MSSEMRKIINLFGDYKKKLIENVEEKVIKETVGPRVIDVDYTYNMYPELNNIGNKEQYRSYLDSIFPSSVVKNILQHRTSKKFTKFKTKFTTKSSQNRFFFSPFDTGRYGDNKILVILNIKNLAKPGDEDWMEDLSDKHPEYTEGKSEWFYLPAQVYGNPERYGFDGVFDFEGTNDDEYSVSNPNQIHILGNKKDLNGFKSFIKRFK